MGKVVLEMSGSLDGFVTGPDVSPEQPMGDDGELLHEWMFAGRSGAEARNFQAARFSRVGAVIVGRRMADLGIGPWGDEPVFHAPVFVVTHRPAETIVKRGGTSYTFVTDGPEHALVRARAAAGADDVLIGGGADVARQYLQLGAIEELQLHLVPVTLGAGTRLFAAGDATNVRLRPLAAEADALATHLTYAVERTR